MYADRMTPSMESAIDETNRRRAKQVAYNVAHGVDPQPLRKKIADITEMLAREDENTQELLQTWQGTGARGDKSKKAPVPGLSRMHERLPDTAGIPSTTWPNWSNSSPARCTPLPASCSSSSLPGCVTRSRN